MLELLPALCLAVLAVLGSGVFLGRSVEGGGLDPLIWAGLRGLVGIAALATLGGLLNMFLPLGKMAPWIMFPLAGLGVWVFIKQSSGALRLVLVSLVLLAACLAARPPVHGDTGLYHQQAVIWMSESALPLGLANLHGRFGFNSAWWNFAGLLQMPWMARGEAMYLATPVVCVFSGLLFAGALRRAWSSGLSVAVVMLLTGGYLWLRQMSGANNPSLSTDAPTNLFIVASAAALVFWRTERAPRALLVWAVLASAAATFKLTGLPWLASSAMVVVWYALVESRGRGAESGWRFFVPGVVAGLLIMAVNAARGIMVSGYPFYPLRLAGFSALPWTVRPETVGGDVEGIRSWPTRGDASGWVEFICLWIENQYGLTNVMIGMLLALIAVPLLVFAWRRGVPESRPLLKMILPVVSAAAAGLAVGLVYAPALRFVSGYFFILAGCLIGLGVMAFGPACSMFPGRLMAVLAVALAILPNSRGLLARPIAWSTIPPVPETVAALEVRTTAQGERIKIGYAWDAEPPATPYFNPQLIIVRDSDGQVREFRVAPQPSEP